jgi:RNA polymerase sigma-70 factor (ECF subfamily)
MMTLDMTLETPCEQVDSVRPVLREATCRLLLEQRHSVFMLCLGFARDQAEAQDLTQETFIKALRHLEQHDEPGHIRPWLLRIARNLCIDQIRKDRLHRFFQPWLAPDETDEASPDHLHGAGEEIALVRSLIRTLPTRQREVLVLREYGELSYAEIAGMLKLSEGTVMSRLNRARSALMKAFKEKTNG